MKPEVSLLKIWAGMALVVVLSFALIGTMGLSMLIFGDILGFFLGLFVVATVGGMWFNYDNERFLRELDEAYPTLPPRSQKYQMLQQRQKEYEKIRATGV